MADKPLTAESPAPLDPGAPAAPMAPRRPPGHRSTDVRDTVAEMANLVRCLTTIDRAAVRAEAVRRFSDSAVIDEYERLYRYVRAA